MFKLFKQSENRGMGKFVYLFLLMMLTVTFSCNKNDWWDLFKKGGKVSNGCIDKSKINPYKICRQVSDPVCGCDGKDYLNPCEAGKNGVIKFTKGKCKPDNKVECFDKSKYNPNAICPKVYDPVCGCDGKDYNNPCEAEKNGIVKYTKGKCNRNGGDGCFDKSKFNPDAPCTKEYNPVCGCDGVEYPNPCTAEKNGIIKYTMGKCNQNNKDTCFDKGKYDPDRKCPTVYDPVCGCDGKDYNNPCEAEKNGIIGFKKGKCR